MGIYQRVERVGARITLIVEEEKQGKGYVDFITSDGVHRFASFITEDYDAEHDIWAGKDSEVYTALQEAFDKDSWITLVLVRVNSENDFIKRTEAYNHT